MAIYDCFLYNGEAELLDIRLNVLDPVVDRFVLVESTRTFSGKHKELRYKQQREAFKRFWPKITYIETTSPYTSAWENEDFARYEMLQGLRGCAPDDTILVSDLDEIANPAAIHHYARSPGIKALQMRLYYYHLNCQAEGNWDFARMASYADVLLAGGPQVLRYVTEGVQMVPDCGHHWSYLMTPEQIREKIESFPHTELDDDRFKNQANIVEAIEAGRDLYGRDLKFTFVPLDESYPAYIRNQQARFAHLIKPVPGAPQPKEHKEVVDPGLYSFTPKGLMNYQGLYGYMLGGDLDAVVEMASLVPQGGTYVEIGSFMGLSSCLVGRTLMGSNPTAKFYCVDLWEDFYLDDLGLRVEPTIGDRHLYDIFRENLQKMQLDGFVQARRSDSVKASFDFPDASVDVLFIDGDHSYKGCYGDLVHWYPKRAPGGLIFGHDCVPGGEVDQAVKQFTSERGLSYRVDRFPGSHYIFELLGMDPA